MALFDQFAAQCLVVFGAVVVHDSNADGDTGVGVTLTGDTMSVPPGVSNAGIRFGARCCCLEFCQASTRTQAI